MKNSLFLQNDGFYFGHQLKNGALSKDAIRITEDEIALMYATMMSAYCRKNNTDTLIVKDIDGRTIISKMTETGK